MQDVISQIEREAYKLLVESVKDYAIFMLDTEGRVLSWNKGAEHIKGYSAEEIIGQHFSVFYTLAEIANGEPERNLRKAAELGRFEQEGWRQRKDGSVFWANVVFTALRNDKGQLIGYGKVTRDLTRKKNTEEEIKRLNKELEKQLHKSREQLTDYQHALDESAIVAITDQKGVIRHVNDNFCKISKYPKDELLGQDHRIINAGFHASDFIRDLWVTIAHGKIWRGELKNKAKDGSYYWVDTTIVPFIDEKGKPYQYLAIRSDITSRKLAEEELHKSKADLEKRVQERTMELIQAIEREKVISELKSRFVSMASHEFRTPLSSILSSVSLIDHYSAMEHTEKRQKHIARIKSSVMDLTGILEDFLSLEKLESGKLDIHYADFGLNEFMEDTMEEIEAMMKRKAQKIDYNYTGLPQVSTDKKILRNIVLNLLTNAIKYSPEHSTIYIAVEVTDYETVIRVRDEGIGIPTGDQKNIFSQFFRSTNASSISGTGLGLNIVKRYIELLKGNIFFNSQENNGTTFTVQLPSAKENS